MSDKRKPAWSEFATIGRAAILSAFVVLITAAFMRASAQAAPGLQGFLRQNIGLSQDEIASIRKGQPVTKTLPSRTPAEVFLFGAVYINAVPERYLELNRDFDRLRKLPNYLGLGVLGNPAQPSDLAGFSFDKEDVQALKNCKPGDCLIQMPAGTMEEVRRSISWSSPDVNEEVNQLLRKTALQRLAAYRREGNPALESITTSPTRSTSPGSSQPCLVTVKRCQNVCPTFTTIFSLILKRNLRTSKTRFTGNT